MDIVETWLWIGILGVLCVIGTAWLLVAHRRLDKPLPRSMKWGMIFGVVAIMIVIAGAILASLH